MDLPVFEYKPMQVKQAVVGYGGASKHQVMDMTRRILRLERLPRPDDAADAIAHRPVPCPLRHLPAQPGKGR